MSKDEVDAVTWRKLIWLCILGLLTMAPVGVSVWLFSSELSEIRMNSQRAIEVIRNSQKGIPVEKPALIPSPDWTLIGLADNDAVTASYNSELATMRSFYNMINRRYFDSQLPRNVRFGLVRDRGDLASWHPEQKIIKINPTILVGNMRQAKLAVLHEMCHISRGILHGDEDANPFGGESHGEAFQAEMLRLANLGAFKGIW